MLENTEVAIKMDNLEKLATYGTQDEDKTKQKTQHNMHYTQTNTNNVYKTWALLQTTGGKDEPTSFVCGNRNVHDNTELGA